jgi:hypothetical protein
VGFNFFAADVKQNHRVCFGPKQPEKSVAKISGAVLCCGTMELPLHRLQLTILPMR